MGDPTKGLQLDANTIALYKRTRETQLGTIIGANTVVDAEGAYPLTTENQPSITWNVTGSADPTNFARAFTRNLASLDTRLRSAVVDAAFLTANLAEHTVHVLFRIDDPGYNGTYSAGLYVAAGPSGAGVANDFVERIVIINGQLETFHESSDVNQQFLTDNATHGLGANLFVPGVWYVATLVKKDREAGAKWTAEFYLGGGAFANGTLIQVADTDVKWDQGNGLKQQAGSGTAGKVSFGQSAETADTASALWGSIGYSLFVKKVQTPTEIAAVHAELLSDGTLVTNLPAPADRLFRYEFNEPPDWIDEGTLGLHMHSTGNGSDFAAEDPAILDFIGTGGRPWVHDASSARLVQRINAAGIKTKFGGELHELFSDALVAVPSYTIQMWTVLHPPTALRALAVWDDSGESFGTNFLLQMTLSTAFLSGWFAERGPSGTNITLAPASEALLGTAGDLDNEWGRLLFSVRVDEDAANPGIQRVRWSVNDNIDVADGDASGVAQGGFDGYGLLFGSWDGLVQEIKVSKGAISDAQILADFANVGTGITPDTIKPTIKNVSPASGIGITPTTTISFDAEDETGLARVMIIASFADGVVEVVHDGDAFRGKYTGAANTRIAIANGFSFTVLRDGGWVATPTFEYISLDRAGNIGVLA